MKKINPTLPGYPLCQKLITHPLSLLLPSIGAGCLFYTCIDRLLIRKLTPLSAPTIYLEAATCLLAFIVSGMVYVKLHECTEKQGIVNQHIA